MKKRLATVSIRTIWVAAKAVFSAVRFSVQLQPKGNGMMRSQKNMWLNITQQGRPTPPKNKGVDAHNKNNQNNDKCPGAFGFLPRQLGQFDLEHGEGKKEDDEAKIPKIENRSQHQEGDDPAGAGVEGVYEAVAKFVFPGDEHGIVDWELEIGDWH